MRSLSTTELLGVWERAAGQSPVQRALTFLAAACPESAPEILAEMSIGQRDARLMELRERTFGPVLDAVAACPACGEQVELSLDLPELRSAARQTSGPEPDPSGLSNTLSHRMGEGRGEGRLSEEKAIGEPDGAARFSVTVDGHELLFRLPNSADLMALPNQDDLGASRRQLLDRCLLRGGDDATDASLAAVVEQMTQADPLADIELALACPACGHSWEAPFDIVSFFWRELNAWAGGILREVHTLAAAYGWREADVLALSPARRQAYLEMVSA